MQHICVLCCSSPIPSYARETFDEILFSKLSWLIAKVKAFVMSPAITPNFQLTEKNQLPEKKIENIQEKQNIIM